MTLMAESEEEPKRLLIKVKEESEKVGLKLNILKTKTSLHLWGGVESWGGVLESLGEEEVKGLSGSQMPQNLNIQALLLTQQPEPLPLNLHLFQDLLFLTLICDHKPTPTHLTGL